MSRLTTSGLELSLKRLHTQTWAATVQHPVTIGANQGKVLEPRLGPWLKFGKRRDVMAFDEVFAQVSVRSLEVEAANLRAEYAGVFEG